MKSGCNYNVMYIYNFDFRGTISERLLPGTGFFINSFHQCGRVKVFGDETRA
jgi:hypothetical protein